MKKLILTGILTACFLCACSSSKRVTGQVLEVVPATETELAQILIDTDEGEKAVICMDKETFVMSWVEDVDTEAFKDGEITNVQITALYGDKKRVTSSDGKKMNSYTADNIQIDAVLMEDVFVLEDGTVLDAWERSNSTNYQLKDGTELLVDQTPYGPHNSYVGGVESLDTMPEAAQGNILSYYEKQGILYDLNEELERAYGDYKENPEGFSSYMLAQCVSPSASNDKIICYLTTVQLPIDGKHGQEIRLGAVFDRESGVHISNYELFSCSKEEVLPKLLDLAKINDQELRREMEAAFKPEYMVLFTENLEVAFPAGTLPSQEHCYLLGFDLSGDIKEILNDWAIPKAAE